MAQPILPPEQIKKMRDDMARDAVQALQDGETQPLDYVMTYESPVDPEIVVEFSIKSYRLKPTESVRRASLRSSVIQPISRSTYRHPSGDR